MVRNKRASARLRGLAVLGMMVTGTAWSAGASAGQPSITPAAPIDPFDYSYCGGKPVYPVIGFNFATACGPRNQIGLGRRGHLMWLFPPQREGDSPVRSAIQATLSPSQPPPLGMATVRVSMSV